MKILNIKYINKLKRKKIIIDIKKIKESRKLLGLEYYLMDIKKYFLLKLCFLSAKLAYQEKFFIWDILGWSLSYGLPVVTTKNTNIYKILENYKVGYVGKNTVKIQIYQEI